MSKTFLLNYKSDCIVRHSPLSNAPLMYKITMIMLPIHVGHVVCVCITCQCMVCAFFVYCSLRASLATWKRSLEQKRVTEEVWRWDTMQDTTATGHCWLPFLFQPVDVIFTTSRFAQLAATVLVNKKFKVCLFSSITPTPFTVSYSCYNLILVWLCLSCVAICRVSFQVCGWYNDNCFTQSKTRQRLQSLLG